MKITIEDTPNGIKVISEPNFKCRNVTTFKESNIGFYDCSNKYIQALTNHFNFIESGRSDKY